MTRSLQTATATALTQSPLYLVWILRLDVASNPVYINSGFANLTFSSGTGVDPALVGFTFSGVGNIGTIDAITDTSDGSQSLNVTLPGINLANDYLNQFVNNADLWQRLPAFLWCMVVDNTGALIGQPFRVRQGRMDQITMVIDPDNQTGTLTVSIEGQQSYSGEALNTRYNEQRQIDSTDASQDLAAAIAMAVPGIGNSASNPVGFAQIAQNFVNYSNKQQN